MRKAKTPPKRKPVPAGRRAAKRKAGKDPRAKVGKTVKASSVTGKVATKLSARTEGKTVGKIAGKTAGKIAGKIAGKTAGKIAGTTAGHTALKPSKAGTVANSAKTTAGSAANAARKPAPKSGVPTSPAASSKEPARATAKPAAVLPRQVAKAPSAAQRPGHEPKDPKKMAPERSADKAASGGSRPPMRPDGAGAMATSTDKPVEATAPASLPIPIASFTI